MRAYRLILCSFILLWATSARAEPSVENNGKFVYEQKFVGQVKEKPVRVKVIVSRFETSLEVVGSLFNPVKAGQKEKSDTKDINVKIEDARGILEAEMKKEEKYSDADLLVGLMTDKLRRSGFFDVVERQGINEIAREINFDNSDWAKKDNVNKLGNISGAQYLVSGKLLMNKDGHRVGSSRYTLALRLCNINTGEILSSSTGQYDTVDGAVEESVQKLTEEIHSLPWTCRIAKVEPTVIFFNAGFSDNLKKGDVFSVVRIGDSIIDPVTGSVLGFAKEEVAKIRVEEILENSLSKAKIISQKGEIKVGDIVSAKAPNQKTDERKKWYEIFGNKSSKKIDTTSQIKLDDGAASKMSNTDSLASDIASRFSKSIVLIIAGSSQGSGFIIATDGYILTNSHVVDGQKTVTVKLIEENKVYSNVEVVKDNPIRDMALLKIKEADSFVPVVLGDSDQVQVGERVVVIGNPKGLENTVADGLVSAIREVNGTKMLQISAPITHGSSGGAMFNSRGEVVGITSLGLGEANLNFAVAINYAKQEMLK